MNTSQAMKMLRDALAHAESVYRLNVVKDGGPSSTLQNMQSALAATANIEAYGWTPAATPPGNNNTVLLALSDGDVWQGYYADGVWRDTSGLPLDTIRVTHWAHTPEHPDLTMTITAKPAEAIESWHTGLPLPGEEGGAR